MTDPSLAPDAAHVAIAGMVFANAHDVVTVMIGGALIALGNNSLIANFHPYAAELFPTRIGARAVGFTSSWSRISSIFIGYRVASLLAAFGPRTNGRALEILSP